MPKGFRRQNLPDAESLQRWRRFLGLQESETGPMFTAAITQEAAVDYSGNVAHRNPDCPEIRGRRWLVNLELEPGADFLTVAPGQEPSGRSVHLVPCPHCVGAIVEAVDPKDPDKGTQAKKGLKAGPFK